MSRSISPLLFGALILFIGFGALLDWGIYSKFLGKTSWESSQSLLDSALNMTFVMLLSVAYKLSLMWFETERLKRKAQLNLLKSQVNPHFLFNSLNTIYSLAHQKSDKTEDAILKLSSLMRYMIYETDVSKIELEKEIEYLNNFIELQTLRLSKNVKIKFCIEGTLIGKKIEPMLLISFVENAFKHGISYSKPSEIRIDMSVTSMELLFRVENTAHKQTNSSKEDSGFGLRNITERLRMLYPDRHQLSIHETADRHIVELKLKYVRP